MSIWGKVVGGAAGFAVGGPIGALIGAAAGHAVDRFRDAQEEDEPDATKRIGFTIGVIVLGAKMAKVDGQVTNDEIAAFKRVFRIPPDEEKNVARLFDQARRDAHGFEPNAQQIARMLNDRPGVLEELLDCLFHIARADGRLHPDEVAYLKQIADIFGIGADDFARIRTTHLGADERDPYIILGVSRTDPDAAIRRKYRALIRQHHPDRLMAQGLPPEFINVANRKMGTINAAYDQIAQERGIG